MEKLVESSSIKLRRPGAATTVSAAVQSKYKQSVYFE
jgi:hypothetical protein